MTLISCPACEHRTSAAAACCPQCAHPIRDAVRASDQPAVVVARDYNEQQTVDGLANVIEALSILAPAIVAGGAVWCLTEDQLATGFGAVFGFAGAYLFAPFRRYVNNRSLFIKVLAAGMVSVAIPGVVNSLAG